MKNTVLALFTGLILVSACKSGDESNAIYMQQMQDSILHNYASVYTTTIEVKSGSILNVTVGSSKLYAAPDAERQKMANEIGMLAFRVFPKDNSLEKGTLIISNDEKSVKPDPSTTKATPINLDSIRIVLAKASK